MDDIKIERGLVVRSEAGHDRGLYFVVYEVYENGYLGLVDGMTRKIAKPKKKKQKHVTPAFPRASADIAGMTNRVAARIVKEARARAEISVS